MEDDEKPKLAAHFKKKQEVVKPETTFSRYEKAVDEYKSLLTDKIHPKNRTVSYDKNVKSILNRLLVAADDLDAEQPGAGIFGLIVLSLKSSLAMKDRNLELEVQIRDLEKRINRLDKQ